jgi:uncharacterized membrane protein YhaH (DUF805 family)
MAPIRWRSDRIKWEELMSLAGLFTSFEGRINRKPYWIGNLIIVAIVLVVVIALLALTGIDFDTGQYKVPEAIFSLVLLYPCMALAVKRLHDRDKSGSLALIFAVPYLIQIATDLLGYSGDPNTWNTLDYVLNGILGIVSLWFLVELGFLRGTPGPNRYGPDPLARQDSSLPA